MDDETEEDVTGARIGESEIEKLGWDKLRDIEVDSRDRVKHMEKIDQLPTYNADDAGVLVRVTMDEEHLLQLPDHTTHLSDKNFITHMLYKNAY